ncbi:hypothetical protein PO909_030650 [Leuciscus waleckii]
MWPGWASVGSVLDFDKTGPGAREPQMCPRWGSEVEDRDPAREARRRPEAGSECAVQHLPDSTRCGAELTYERTVWTTLVHVHECPGLIDLRQRHGMQEEAACPQALQVLPVGTGENSQALGGRRGATSKKQQPPDRVAPVSRQTAPLEG